MSRIAPPSCVLRASHCFSLSQIRRFTRFLFCLACIFTFCCHHRENWLLPNQDENKSIVESRSLVSFAPTVLRYMCLSRIYHSNEAKSDGYLPRERENEALVIKPG